MTGLTPSVMALLFQQHGHVTIAQLRRGGVHRSARERLIADGTLEVIAKSVLRASGAPHTLASTCAGLSLAHPDGFITGVTAGQLLGLRRMPPTAPIDLCVRHGVHLDGSLGVRLRQSTKVDDSDSVLRPDGIRIASPARLAFDLARDLTRTNLASAVEQLIRHHGLTAEDFVRIVIRLARKGRRGSRRAASVALQRKWDAPVESHAEFLVLRGLLRRRIPVVTQYSGLVMPDGTRIRLDLAVPAVRWAVEIDLHPAHLDTEGTTRDKRRDRFLHSQGWQVERVTEFDLLQLSITCDELASLYRRRITHPTF